MLVQKFKLTVPPDPSEHEWDETFYVGYCIYRGHGAQNRVIRNQRNRVIGVIRIHGCDQNEIGYYLISRYRGRGIMTAMVGEFCQASHLNHIVARVRAGNIPSLRVLEKNSFLHGEEVDGWIASTWQRS